MKLQWGGRAAQAAKVQLDCALVTALLLAALPAVWGCSACAGSYDDGTPFTSLQGNLSPELLGVDPPHEVRAALGRAELAAEAAEKEGFIDRLAAAEDARYAEGRQLRTGIPGVDAPWYSKKWGKAGEKWSAKQTHIMDVSYAGYKEGKAWPPKPSAGNVYNIKAFGAKGNGKHDDSQAFINAFASYMTGTLYIPAGTYRITKPLTVKSSLVLRGAGQSKTVLYFPYSFTDLFGNNNVQGPDRTRWGGGPFWLSFSGGDNPGRDADKRLALVTKNASKGARVIAVDSAKKIKVGQLVRLVMTDPGQGQMIKYLLDPVVCSDNSDGRSCGPFGQDGNISRMLGRYDLKFYRHFSYVTAKTAHSITLERPLPEKILTSWGPLVERYAPALQRVGIQDLNITFKAREYLGHFHEYGYNAVGMSGVANSWMWNVGIANSDIGVQWVGVSFSTMNNVRIYSTKGREQPCCGNNGHHGFWLILSSDNVLVNNFVKGKFVHDYAFENAALFNVITKGGGGDMNVDFHRYMPWGNLITDIDCGFCNRLYVSSGAGDKGPHAGPYNTFWNIRSNSPSYFKGKVFIRQEFPPGMSWGPKFNFVGVVGQNNTWHPMSYAPNQTFLLGIASTDAKGKRKIFKPQWWVEDLPQHLLRPTNLLTSMQATRKKRLAAQPKIK